MHKIHKLLEQAASALESEIETVREKPSTDLLFNGKKVKNGMADTAVDYQFTSYQSAIRFAEEIKAASGEKSWTVYPVSFEENELILRFPGDAGETIDQLHVEWENDYILQCTLSEIGKLREKEKKKKNIIRRLERLFVPDGSGGGIAEDVEILEDGQRNRAQIDAIQKALRRHILFIWGPPGTGKTATLGYIVANYLKQGKSVLFASNTNRAVDVGLLSVLDALRQTGLEKEIDPGALTRFGEAALKSEQLEPLLFDVQIETVAEQRKQEAAGWVDLLSRREKILRSVEKRLKDGKQPTNNQELELKLIDQKIGDLGGIEQLEEKMEELTSVNERAILRNKRFVATTLAKVCTSDLFYGIDFDAVVVDEASMANLPYMMVLASHAKWHFVAGGDPMQLPPIALTSDHKSRAFLERDIFTTVSGATQSEELFQWHDENPEFTAFFDTQYRLESSLADIISSVFYEGRLKTGKAQEPSPTEMPDRAFHLVDTSKYGPYLEQKSGERGFKPVNLVHQEVIERLAKNMGKRGIRMEQVGVIVPFRSAVYDVRNRLFEAGVRNVEVGTIHTFQGREKDYIIFDTVMSGEKQRRGIRHYSVRPLDEEKNGLSVPRLLNVAFSRCRKELVVIADMGHVERVYGEKFLGRLLGKLKNNE